MKVYLRLVSLALCASLLLAAAACNPLTVESSSQVSTTSQSTVESTPTPTPTPTPSPSPTPEASPEASPTPAGDFEEEFSQNPIDLKMGEDLMKASSSSQLQKAYNNAASRWEKVIQTAFAGGQAALEGDDLAALEQEQQVWEDELDSQLQAIRDENGEDPYTASQKIVEYYRERAKALCQIVFEATGEMPEFPSTDGEAVG